MVVTSHVMVADPTSSTSWPLDMNLYVVALALRVGHVGRGMLQFTLGLHPDLDSLDLERAQVQVDK